MCAVWLKLITILSLSCTALGSGSSRVVWRDFGGQVVIECRSPEENQEYLELRAGLLKDRQILFKDRDLNTFNAFDEFEPRVQLNGKFPNIDILIQNLTTDDTGPYWCIYMKLDMQTTAFTNVTGGSMLLVVTDKMKPCDLSNNNNYLLKMVIVVIGAVLLFSLFGVITWCICKNMKNSTRKARPVGTNDVYEDMRGTIRR